MKDRRATNGGKRPGAGRPKATITITIHKETTFSDDMLWFINNTPDLKTMLNSGTSLDSVAEIAVRYLLRKAVRGEIH